MNAEVEPCHLGQQLCTLQFAISFIAIMLLLERQSVEEGNTTEVEQECHGTDYSSTMFASG